MNELINHEAVYRTAPATPGLLIIGNKGVCRTAPATPGLLNISEYVPTRNLACKYGNKEGNV